MLDRSGEGLDLLFQSGFVAVHQDGGFPVRQAFAEGGFFQDSEHSLVVFALALSFPEGIKYLFVVDEFLGMDGLGIIHGHCLV